MFLNVWRYASIEMEGKNSISPKENFSIVRDNCGFGSGLTNCSKLSSCREGCTLEHSSCHHILVEQILVRDTAFTTSQDRQTISRAQLRVNAKGCGYPPSGKSSRWTNMFNFSIICYFFL